MADDSFFEDETLVESEAQEKEPKTKGVNKQAPKKAVKKRPKKKGKGQAQEPSLGLVWVTVLVLFSFFLGFSLGMWVIPSLTGGTSETQQQQQPAAPPLTQDQLQQGMPEGHPTVGGTGETPSGTSTPSGESPGTAP